MFDLFQPKSYKGARSDAPQFEAKSDIVVRKVPSTNSKKSSSKTNRRVTKEAGRNISLGRLKNNLSQESKKKLHLLISSEDFDPENFYRVRTRVNKGKRKLILICPRSWDGKRVSLLKKQDHWEFVEDPKGILPTTPSLHSNYCYVEFSDDRLPLKIRQKDTHEHTEILDVERISNGVKICDFKHELYLLSDKEIAEKAEKKPTTLPKSRKIDIYIRAYDSRFQVETPPELIGEKYKLIFDGGDLFFKKVSNSSDEGVKVTALNSTKNKGFVEFKNTVTILSDGVEAEYVLREGYGAKHKFMVTKTSAGIICKNFPSTEFFRKKVIVGDTSVSIDNIKEYVKEINSFLVENSGEYKVDFDDEGKLQILKHQPSWVAV